MTGHLKGVYDLDGEGEVRAYYDDWAGSYDSELAEAGYATPRRCAAALAASDLPKDAPILDMGCGTGLSGAALAEAGFTVIDGCDLSAGMLEQARARGIYRDLFLAGQALPESYRAVAAVGVIGPGAGPVELFDQCLALLPPGGRLVFSYNDHALEVPEFPARLEAALSSGAARRLFEERGPHLPSMGIESTVYVIEKA
ncbi:class I SAM-dependent DNA methyltransferase [Pseudoroseicyclus tamaricis]|uniref:Methyltransferase domain-containing protein n=1 Tax=Pseudoroseicyclus tamaricis TaxID=2705421 RepID=A0A6B2JSU3_9RHOB|nr:methyltransferase domain-containing protein [Pseudoroseicyclus tamaricis]NDV01298.1 methyltransferase domain-containing protein [Pseudoroseicyclus tamaricis]